MILKHATVEGEEYVRTTDVVEWLWVIGREAQKADRISAELLNVKLDNFTQRLLELK